MQNNLPESKNLISEKRILLNQRLPYFMQCEHIIGVTLNGGMARGYVDKYSEIDLTLYVRQDTYDSWNQGRCPFTIGIQILDNHLYDIAIKCIEKEAERNWTHVDQWDFNAAKILYDPFGGVKNLFSQKRLTSPDVSDIEGLMFDAWWNINLATTIWIYRENPLQAKVMLQAGLNALVKTLHVINKVFIPHDKWLYHEAKSLTILPQSFFERVEKILTCPMTISATQEALDEALALWEDIETLSKKHHYSTYPVNTMQVYFYDALRYLRDNPRVSIENFGQKYPLSLLNQDPFAKVCILEQDTIVYLPEVVATFDRDTMYSWFSQLVQAIQK